MRPLRLTAKNYVRIPSLTVDFNEGTCGYHRRAKRAGRQECGAPRDRACSLRGQLRETWRSGSVCSRSNSSSCLVFDHSGEPYRVRRAYGKNKATLNLERHHFHPIPNHPEWEPLTPRVEPRENPRPNSSASSASPAARFSAWSYLAQGDAGAFTEASPADRKAILSDVLNRAASGPTRPRRRSRTQAGGAGAGGRPGPDRRAGGVPRGECWHGGR